MIKAFFTAIFAVLLILGLAFFVFPVMGGVAIAAGTLIWIVSAIVLGFCALIMAMFIVSSSAVLVLGGMAGLWLFLAVIFLPIMFPILLPLFVLAVFVTYARKNRKLIRNKEQQSP